MSNPNANTNPNSVTFNHRKNVSLCPIPHLLTEAIKWNWCAPLQVTSDATWLEAIPDPGAGDVL